jgi:hypothetical protein
MTYTPDAHGVKAATGYFSSSMSSYRGGQSSSVAYTQQQQDQAAGTSPSPSSTGS